MSSSFIQLSIDPPIFVIDHVCRGEGACSAIVNVTNKPQNLTFTCKKIVLIFCVLPKVTIRIGVLSKFYFCHEKPPNNVWLDFKYSIFEIKTEV
jgi:hypothetical protein